MFFLKKIIKRINPICDCFVKKKKKNSIKLGELAGNVISYAPIGRPKSQGPRFPHQTWLPRIASTPQFPIAAKFRISQIPLFTSPPFPTHHFPNFFPSSPRHDI